MKQLLQNNRTGDLQIAEVPIPNPAPHQLLVQTRASLVSVGTEKYLLEFAQKNLLAKALSRPDLVRQVMSKARTEGIQEAWRQSMARLDTPATVGYSSAGLVIGVGCDVRDFAIGDRVACSGSGFAAHAEVVVVPSNLCVRIPHAITFEAASFAALGGIALEAVRMANVVLGSRVCVIGLGLLGQLTLQLLRASGCRVVGMDPDSSKTALALEHGAESVATSPGQLRSLTPSERGCEGFDAVIIAAATSSNEPLECAAEACRERGRVVATGLVGLEVPRKPFYDKELELVISRAWGPGLYDQEYTESTSDYALPHTRWTAQRNLQAFLEQLKIGAVKVEHLVSHQFEFSESQAAYDLILSGAEPYLGVVLAYPDTPAQPPEAPKIEQVIPPGSSTVKAGKIGIGLIGAGLFANGTLLPELAKQKGIQLRGIASARGLSAKHAAARFKADYCTSNHLDLLRDPAINLIFILTRHGSHAELVSEALRAGKNVFVEKPLATSSQQLVKLVIDAQIMNGGRPLLMVGFNRRYAPCTTWIKDRFADVREPLAIQCTVNAGQIPSSSWVHDPEQGGGRIVGELCHFVDLVQCLTGSLPKSVFAESLSCDRYSSTDNLVVTMKMHDGSIASITYLASGDKSHPRERIEIYGGGSVGVIDNFRSATFTHAGRKKSHRHWTGVDRGHRAELEVLFDAIGSGTALPVALKDYVYTTLATLAIEESLRTATPVTVDPESLLKAL